MQAPAAHEYSAVHLLEGLSQRIRLAVCTGVADLCEKLYVDHCTQLLRLHLSTTRLALPRDGKSNAHGPFSKLA